MELREGQFEFVDNDHTSRTGKQKLTTVRVLKDGRVLDT